MEGMANGSLTNGIFVLYSLVMIRVFSPIRVLAVAAAFCGAAAFFAAPAQAQSPATLPEGTVLVTSDGLTRNNRTPFSRNQQYSWRLNITNGVDISGGETTWRYLRAKADGVTILGGGISGTSSSSLPGWVTDGSIEYIGMRATYKDAAAGISVHFDSTLTFIPQPTEGTLSLSFDDKEYDAPGAVLTITMGAFTDANNDGAAPGGFVSLIWQQRANNDADFITLTSGGADNTLYTIQSAEFTGLLAGQKPLYRFVGVYQDGIGYQQTFIATAEVNMQPSETSCHNAGQIFSGQICVPCTGATRIYDETTRQCVAPPDGFQTSLILDGGNLHITGEILRTGSAIRFACCFARNANEAGTNPQSIGGNSFPSRHFISGADGLARQIGDEGTHTVVYNLGAILNAAYDFARPFVFFEFLGRGADTFRSNAIRVAGITGGTVRVVRVDGERVSIDISGLSNAVSRPVQPYELTYRWQTQAAGADEAWADATGAEATTQVYPLAAGLEGLEGRVIVADKTGLASAQTVRAPVFATETILDKEHIRITSQLIGNGGHATLQCCYIKQANEAFTNADDIRDPRFPDLDPLPSYFVVGGAGRISEARGNLENHIALYNLSAVLNESFDYSRPFVAFDYVFGTEIDFNGRPTGILRGTPIRVAGITGGEVGIGVSVNISLHTSGFVSGFDGIHGIAGEIALSINISNLTNVVGRAPLPQELTYQWQTQVLGDDNAWADAPGDSATTRLYTLTYADGLKEARALVSDRAALAPVQTITASLPVATYTLKVDTAAQRIEFTGPRRLLFNAYQFSSETSGNAQLVGLVNEFYSTRNLLRAKGNRNQPEFDFSRPFIGFNSLSNPGIDFSDRVRVAGITGGRVVVNAEQFSPRLSANISGLTNVLAQTPQPHELTYQWQRFNGVHGWEDVTDANATAQVYTVTPGFPVRVVVSDKAGLADPQAASGDAVSGNGGHFPNAGQGKNPNHRNCD